GRDADGRHPARVPEARGDGDAPGGDGAYEAGGRVVEARDARVARGPGGAGGEVLGRAARVEAGGAELGGGVAGEGRGGWFHGEQEQDVRSAVAARHAAVGVGRKAAVGAGRASVGR